MSRRADRDAAIAVSLQELAEERNTNVGEADLYPQAKEEDEERHTKQKQQDILRQHPTSDYRSFEQWQKALRNAGFYYVALDDYAAVARNPDAFFCSYDDMGDPWVTSHGALIVPGVGFFVNGHYVHQDMDLEPDQNGPSPDDEHPVFTRTQLEDELYGPFFK